MGWKRIGKLDFNPMTGKQEWLYADTQNPGIVGIVEVDHSVDQVIERNKRKYAQTDERAGWKGDWHQIGEVPMSIFWDLWKRSNHGKDQEVLRRFVNDKDNRYFLTRPVKL